MCVPSSQQVDHVAEEIGRGYKNNNHYDDVMERISERQQDEMKKKNERTKLPEPIGEFVAL